MRVSIDTSSQANDWSPPVVPSLRLRQLQLLDASGVALPTSSLVVRMTSTRVAGQGGSVCLQDGGADASSLPCQSGVGDPSPRLEVSYPCNGGSTTLSRVLLRTGSTGDAAGYSVDFLDWRRRPDRASFAINGSLLEYEVPAAGEVGCAVCVCV